VQTKVRKESAKQKAARENSARLNEERAAEREEAAERARREQVETLFRLAENHGKPRLFERVPVPAGWLHLYALPDGSTETRFVPRY
jgi:hypothetical protein